MGQGRDVIGKPTSYTEYKFSHEEPSNQQCAEREGPFISQSMILTQSKCEGALLPVDQLTILLKKKMNPLGCFF